MQSKTAGGMSVIDIVRSLVLEHGKTLYTEESAIRFKTLLSEALANFQMERKLLTLAISEQMPSRLLRCTNAFADERKHEMLCCKSILMDDYGVMEKYAIDVVNILAGALGWQERLIETLQNSEQPHSSLKSRVPAIDPKIANLIDAASYGDSAAQCQLGDAYFNGEGVAQDYEKAFEWYEKAAAQGNENAQIALQNLNEVRN